MEISGVTLRRCVSLMTSKCGNTGPYTRRLSNQFPNLESKEHDGQVGMNAMRSRCLVFLRDRCAKWDIIWSVVKVPNNVTPRNRIMVSIDGCASNATRRQLKVRHTYGCAKFNVIKAPGTSPSMGRIPGFRSPSVQSILALLLCRSCFTRLVLTKAPSEKVKHKWLTISDSRSLSFCFLSRWIDHCAATSACRL